MTGTSGGERPRPKPGTARTPVAANAPTTEETITPDGIAENDSVVDAKATTTKVDTATTKASVSQTRDLGKLGSRVAGAARRFTAGRSRWVIAAAATLFVALVVLDLLLYRRYKDNDDAKKAADTRNATSVDETYKAAITSAAQQIPQILSYGYKTIDTDIARAGNDLTGQFKSDYTKLLTDTVKPAAVSGKITTKATGVGTSVINATGKDTVSLLVFIDQQTTSGNGKTPQINGTRVQVVMKKVGRVWKISNLTPV